MARCVELSDGLQCRDWVIPICWEVRGQDQVRFRLGVRALRNLQLQGTLVLGPVAGTGEARFGSAAFCLAFRECQLGLPGLGSKGENGQIRAALQEPW